MGPKTVVWLVALGTLSAAHVVAHHAVGAIYDEEHTVTIQGTVGRVVSQTPHPLFYLVVERRGSLARTWAVEIDDVGTPVTSRSTLEPGDQVSVCGNPGRDPGEYRVRMLKLWRSDGLSLRGDVSLADEQCVS